MFYLSVRLILFKVWFKFNIVLLIFCMNDLFSTESTILKPLSIIVVCSLLSPFNSVSIWLPYLGPPTWVHIHLQLLQILRALTPFSFYNDLLFLCYHFWLKNLFFFFLPDKYIAIPTLFWFPFGWNIFLHPLTLSPCVALKLNWVFCRQHIVGSGVFCF